MTRILLICLFSLISSPGLMFARDIVFYHTDNVGSPVAMTNSTGVVVWRANDLPFGEEYQTTENPEHSSRRFIGKEKDKETGLVYIGARYLDPVTGRFLQPDPVGPVDPITGNVNAEMLNNPQRLNRYAYGLNNPYRYIDRDGRDIAVVFGGPRWKNIFGHIAAGVTGNGIYSSGTKENLGSSFSAYLKEQSTYRDSTVYVFPTSKEQDNTFVDAFTGAKAKGHSAMGNNCADILGAGLKAAGIVNGSAALKFPGLMNSYMERKTDGGKVSSVISINKGNKNWSAVDTHLKQFEPQKD